LTPVKLFEDDSCGFVVGHINKPRSCGGLLEELIWKFSPYLWFFFSYFLILQPGEVVSHHILESLLVLDDYIKLLYE